MIKPQPAAPPFRDLLRDALSAAAGGTGGLADTTHSAGYRDMPRLIVRLQAYLESLNIRQDDCLSLELANTVASAVAVLAVLDAGYSVFLMPMEGRGARAAGRSFPGPRFARWLVTVSSGGALADAELAEPASFLDVRENPDFDAAAAPDRAPESLYLRTSGSLGAPKLVERSQARFMRNVIDARDRLRLAPGHRVALPVPIFHAFGLGPAFLGSVLAGASVDLQERANLLRFLEREQDFEPNVAFVTPTFCETLVRGRRRPRPYDFMVTGGDRIGRSTFFRCEELHGPLINAYGSTEMGFSFSGGLDMPAEQRFRTVGRPLAGVDFRIVERPGADAGAASGALQLKYANGFTRYVDLSGNSLPLDTVMDAGWFRTGDLARRGPDDTIEVLGRLDQSVNRNGVLVTFADVEAVLREIADVAEAAVTTGTDSIRGQTLVAFCVLERGAADSRTETLRKHCAANAPAFAVPEHICIVEELPKLGSGKIDRSALSKMAAALEHVS